MHCYVNTAILFVILVTVSSIVTADPICNVTYTSSMETDVFSGTANVYTQFCKEVEKYNGHQPVSWTVNASGDILSDNLPHIGSPVDHTDNISERAIDLAYNPTKKGVPCHSHAGCSDVFRGLSSSCGHNGPFGDLMSYRGSSGAGCGLYTYFITPPSNIISERRCYPLNFFGIHHMKVQDWVLKKLIQEFVCVPSRGIIRANDNSTWLLNKKYTINNVPYVFSVYWQEGCYQRVMEADFNSPIAERQDLDCFGLLWEDFTQCPQNGGIGGNITVGCVVYEYKTIDQRVNGERGEN